MSEKIKKGRAVLLEMPPKTAQSRERVAVLRRNGLGDLICAFPLILYLQKKRGVAVTLFVEQRNAPLIPYLPPVEQVVILPSRGHKYWNLLKAAWPYRGQFSEAISAKTSPMKLSNWFLFCLGAQKRIAYVGDKSWRQLINAPIPYDPEVASTLHQALKGLNLVAPELNEVPEEFFPTLSIPDRIRERYPDPCSLKGPLLLLSATTTKLASRFHPDRYARLLNRLHRFSPFSVLIIGQKQDRERAHEMTTGLQMEHAVHFPRDFDEFMVLLDQADLFFVGDGGVAHIGSALGKHAVVLFGETNPREWKPLSHKVETFYHPDHVDHLDDEEIFRILKQKLSEVKDGRDN